MTELAYWKRVIKDGDLELSQNAIQIRNAGAFRMLASLIKEWEALSEQWFALKLMTNERGATLREERAKLQNMAIECGEAKGQLQRAREDIDTLRARANKMYDALQAYSDHKWDCALRLGHTVTGDECDCGHDAAMAELEPSA